MKPHSTTGHVRLILAFFDFCQAYVLHFPQPGHTKTKLDHADWVCLAPGREQVHSRENPSACEANLINSLSGTCSLLLVHTNTSCHGRLSRGVGVESRAMRVRYSSMTTSEERCNRSVLCSVAINDQFVLYVPSPPDSSSSLPALSQVPLGPLGTNSIFIILLSFHATVHFSPSAFLSPRFLSTLPSFFPFASLLGRRAPTRSYFLSIRPLISTPPPSSSKRCGPRHSLNHFSPPWLATSTFFYAF